jgi:hypothetical protein
MARTEVPVDRRRYRTEPIQIGMTDAAAGGAPLLSGKF